MRANNNPKNRRALLEHNRRKLELADLTEKEARGRRIKTNLEKWEYSLTPVLKRAKPSNLPARTVSNLRAIPLTAPYFKQVIIASSETTSSTFAAYGLIYALLRSGSITPSEIKTTSLLEGYNNISGIFGAREWKDYFFDNDAKVLLIEGASNYLTMLGSKGEEQFWREFIEFTRNNDKLVIITYVSDSKEQSKGAFVPVITSEKEINERLLKKSVYIFMNEEEEKEIRDEQTKAYRGV